MTTIVAPPNMHQRIRRVIDDAELHADINSVLNRVEIAYGQFPANVLARAQALRWLQTQSAGVEELLTEKVKAHPMVITNASGIQGEPIAEHMFGMLLASTRNLYGAQEAQSSGAWRTSEISGSVSLLAGRTLGILGVGAIGRNSAHVGKAFGMRIVGLRRSGKPEEGVDRMYRPSTRLDFFAECDIVFNTLPLTPSTYHFVGREELAAVRSGGTLVNVGRGQTVETHAVVAALASGHLAAALLDVTDPEPLPSDHPLWTMPGCHITPHYAGVQPNSQERTAAIFFENLRRWRDGEPLLNLVDKENGY